MSRLWEAELREQMNFPPTVQTGREVLCVPVELVQTPFIQLKPPNTRTSNQNMSESHMSWCSQWCWPCMLGATQITYYFSVHYLESQSHGIDTGPLCICLPALSPPYPPRLLSSLLNTFGTGLPLWLKNTSVSMVPFFLCACLFGSALARGGLWLGETCAALMKICVSISSKGHSAPTARSHSSFLSSDVQCEIILAWQNTHLQLKHSQTNDIWS